MKIFTAKEAKNRLGQVIDSALSAPVMITKNNLPSVVMVSADAYWSLVGGVEITNDEQFNLLAGVSNGEIEIGSAMSALRLKSKKEFDDLSASFGIGLTDKATCAKQKRREAFFWRLRRGKPRPPMLLRFSISQKNVRCGLRPGVNHEIKT